MSDGSSLSTFDFNPFIEKIKAFPAIQINKFDILLSDIADHVHDLSEAIDELPSADKLDSTEAVSLSSRLTSLGTQLSETMALLYNMEYESHWMYRLENIVHTTMSDMEILLEELKKNRRF